MNNFPESQRIPRGRASLAGPEARPTAPPTPGGLASPAAVGGSAQLDLVSHLVVNLPSALLRLKQTCSPFLSPFLEPKLRVLSKSGELLSPSAGSSFCPFQRVRIQGVKRVDYEFHCTHSHDYTHTHMCVV